MVPGLRPPSTEDFITRDDFLGRVSVPVELLAARLTVKLLTIGALIVKHGLGVYFYVYIGSTWELGIASYSDLFSRVPRSLKGVFKVG